MKSGSMGAESDVNPPIQAQRRRLLYGALAVAASGALQSHSVAAASAVMPGGMSSMMRDAIKACQDCHSLCLQLAMTYCLDRGGRHAEKSHLQVMLNCAELCQTSANFMLSGSALHGRVCAVCAEACEACAKSCEELGDMRQCVDECRRCAESCRTMA